MKVYFLQRRNHRKRQRETVEFLPPEITPLVPAGLDFINDTLLSGPSSSLETRLRNAVARRLPLNCRPVDRRAAAEADLVYTWGCFPLFSPRPFVVEMDNPYGLCYYNLKFFKLLKPLLRKILLSEKCRKIICISEACRQNLIAELGPAVGGKAAVVYPYMADNLTAERPPKPETEPVEFLFVSTQFLLKGGREVLRAFERLPAGLNSKAHLTVVSNTPGEFLEQYKNRPWAAFLKADLDKAVLHREHFAKADVFVLPTYQDSLGLVFLEALSFGLPIIATAMYATSEFVEDGQNGFIFDPPFPFYNRDWTMNQDLTPDLPEKIRQDGEYPEITERVFQGVRALLLDRSLLVRMAARSREKFENDFAPPVRNRAFLRALGL